MRLIRPLKILDRFLRGALAAGRLNVNNASEHAVPGRAIGLMAKRRCLLVTDHLFRIGIPINRAAEVERHVGQMTGNRYLVAVLNAAERLKRIWSMETDAPVPNDIVSWGIDEDGDEGEWSMRLALDTMEDRLAIIGA